MYPSVGGRTPSSGALLGLLGLNVVHLPSPCFTPPLRSSSVSLSSSLPSSLLFSLLSSSTPFSSFLLSRHLPSPLRSLLFFIFILSSTLLYSSSHLSSIQSSISHLFLLRSLQSSPAQSLQTCLLSPVAFLSSIYYRIFCYPALPLSLSVISKPNV